MSGRRQRTLQEIITLPDDALLFPEEAALWLGVTASWVYSHSNGKRKDPHLPATRIGGAVRFRVGTIRNFVRQQEAA